MATTRRLGPLLRPVATALSVRLPTQEGGDVELILVRRIMHRCLPPVLIQSLGRRAFGIFRYRVRPSFGRARQRPSREPLGRLRRAGRGTAEGRLGFCGLIILLPAAEAD